MVEIMGEVEANMNHQQSKLEETGVKTAAVADGVENSLQHIDGIREKMDVLGQSGSAIRDVVEGLSAISEQNAASADSTMQAALCLRLFDGGQNEAPHARRHHHARGKAQQRALRALAHLAGKKEHRRGAQRRHQKRERRAEQSQHQWSKHIRSSPLRFVRRKSACMPV